jgi:hypothetical protein
VERFNDDMVSFEVLGKYYQGSAVPLHDFGEEMFSRAPNLDQTFLASSWSCS